MLDNNDNKNPSVINSASKSLYCELENQAIEMRNNPTRAEKLLWEKLRNKKLGVKFRQQHVVNNFIVDFCSISASLVVEVDGDIHDKQKDKDESRTEILISEGYQVIRFSNEEIIYDMDSVLEQIKKIIANPPFRE